MIEKTESTKTEKKGIGWKKTLLVCIFILLVGTGITSLIFSTEPTAKRTGATKETAMLVEVTAVDRGTFKPEIVATGAVVPAQDIVLSPRVGGQIVERSESFTPGGIVAKGEVLLKIDPADYQNALRRNKSDLRQALSDLAVEKGRGNVAEKDYEFLEQNLSGEKKALVLRKPQLDAAEARVEAARAAVEQAELDLRRTSIRAPFDAHIISRNVNVGSQVTPGENLGRLAGVDTYWVETTAPLSKISWISFPDNAGTKGSPVRIRNRSAWPENQYRTGRVYKLIGALEEQTRMARVLVSVEDPLAVRTNSPDVPPLIIGSFVETLIQAKEISDVVRLDRDYVRKNDTVWVMKDEKLEIRNVGIVFSDANYAYISSGLSENDRVVATNLSTVVEGSMLRVKGSPSDDQGDLESKMVQSEMPAENRSGDEAR